MVRLVRIADVERDILLAHREDRHFMQHLRAAVGKLAQLAVGRALDGARMIDDAGIGHQNAGDIRPVFVDIRIQRRRGQRTRDIRAAARQRAELPSGIRP